MKGARKSPIATMRLEIFWKPRVKREIGFFYEYDELNRLIRETDDRFSSDIGFRYDERGNKTHVLRDGIIREVYTYGQRGELLSVSDEENQDIRFEYDVMGRETLRQFPGGVEQRRIYDDWGRPAGVSAYRETGSMRYDFLWGEGYVYNSGGQRSRIVRPYRQGAGIRVRRYGPPGPCQLPLFG